MTSMEDIGRIDLRPQQVTRTLTRAQTANAVGDGGFYVVAALYFSHVIGLSAAQIGMALTVAWGTGFLLTTPLGQLADRIGLRRAAVGLSVLTAAALVLSTLPRSMVMFVAVTTMYAVAQSAAGAVRQALLVSLVPPAARVAARARLQAAVNAGIGLGAAFGALALLVDRPAAYVVILVADAMTFLFAAVLFARLPSPSARRTTDHAAGPAPASAHQPLAVLRDRPYVALAALNAVLYLYMPMLSVLLPLYVAQRTQAPTWTIGAVFILNTIGVALLQVRASRTVTDPRSAVVAVRRAGVAMLLACVVFGLAGQPSAAAAAAVALACAAALQILGEVLLASGSWEIGFAFADPDRPGQWQGLYSSGIPLARALGPLALTGLVLTWDGPGWLVLGGAFAGAALLVGWVVGRTPQGRRTDTDLSDPRELSVLSKNGSPSGAPALTTKGTR